MQLNVEEMRKLTIQEHGILLAIMGDMEDQVVYLERKEIERKEQECNA